MAAWLVVMWADMTVELMADSMAGLRAAMKAVCWVDEKVAQRAVMSAGQWAGPKAGQ